MPKAQVQGTLWQPLLLCCCLFTDQIFTSAMALGPYVHLAPAVPWAANSRFQQVFHTARSTLRLLTGEGTSQKDRIKHRFDEMETRSSHLETLLSKLIYSDEDTALNTLVRLRAGEPVSDIIQTSSLPPIDALDASDNKSEGYTRRADSATSSQAPSMFGPPPIQHQTYITTEFPLLSDLSASAGSIVPSSTMDVRNEVIYFESQPLKPTVWMPQPYLLT
jgi:hypothetical protein